MREIMQRFNPFEEKPLPIEKTFMDWKKINPCPYNKETTDPYTKCRIVLMNGTIDKKTGYHKETECYSISMKQAKQFKLI